MGLLGVELSAAKTHVSQTHYEFAKRWICPLGEISPIPLSGVVDNITNLGVVLQLFYNLSVTRRLVQFQVGTFREGFCSFYEEITRTLSGVRLKGSGNHI